ncbi:HAD family hydrolase [Nonomuraea rubra]|uniref:HAD superfamily hydrolase (TIGR01549 family) n=1 Tax=Nonomuraea rubra TaxID=46180 RepID=A0A7X0NNY9_9ACTN|nr:HAD family hydrolase [Nonomuraea rubra]MBB6546969.1 HAD superfamily hydrolase (TIGR01549 family) [Nonomuraea rubra]
MFDLDGTLVDTMMSVPTAYADTIGALDGPVISPQDVVAAWNLGPTPAVLAHFLGRSASAEDLECFYRHLDVAAANVHAFPGVVDLLGALSRAGHPLGVFTSATRRAATLMLANAGLKGLFSVVVCGDEVSHPKPSPEGLELACRLLGVEATAAVYVGDAEVDLHCARRAGARGIHASWSLVGTVRACSDLTAQHPRDVIGLVSA